MFPRPLTAFFIAVVAPSVFAVSFDDLVQRIPTDANMLLMLDAKSVFDSELAQREGWKETSSTDFAATPLLLPESAGKVLVGAALDLETMHPHWEVASMELSSSFDADSVEQRVGGISDNIGDVDVIWPYGGLCMAAFSSTEVAAFAPTNRSAAAGWIRRSRQANVGQHHSHQWLQDFIKRQYHDGKRYQHAIMRKLADERNKTSVKLRLQGTSNEPSE